MATNNPLLNQAVRENRFLSPGEYQAPETWLDRLAGVETNPLLSAGLALLTTGQGNNPLATAFQSFTNAAKNKQASTEFDTQQANLVNAEQALVTAPDYSTYQKALNAYVALPGANKDLMATTAATQRERLVGVPMETGMVLDPTTGQSRYVEPVPFGLQMDQKRQLADFEFQYQQKGLDAETARQRAQEEWMAQNSLGGYYQAPSMASGGSMVFDPTTGSMVFEQGPTKGQQQAQALVYAERQKGADKRYEAAANAVAAADQLVTIAGQLSESPLWNKAAEFVEGTIGLGGEAGEAMRNLNQALTPLAIGMHPGGPMTDADFQAYRAAVLDPNQSTESRVQAAKRAASGAQGNLAYLQAQREWFDTHNGSLDGFEATVGAQITEQWRRHRNSLL